MGVGRAIARPWPERPTARVCVSPRARRQLHGHGVDFTGRVTGFAVVNLADEMGGYNWRLSAKRLEGRQMLIDHPQEARHVEPAIPGSAREIQGVPCRTTTGSRCATTRGARNGCRFQERRGSDAAQGRPNRRDTAGSVEVEVARRLRHRFLVRLAEGFLERRDSASPRFFSASSRLLEDRLATSSLSARIRCASLSSGLLPSPAVMRDPRPRFRSITSVDWQQGQVTSSSVFRRAMMRVPSVGSRRRAVAEAGTIIA